MKRILIILTSVLSISAQAQTPHDWENPHVLGIKTSRVPLIHTKSSGAALSTSTST